MAVASLVFAAFFFMSPVIGDASGKSELGDQLLIEGKNHEHVEELQELLTERGFLEDEVLEGKFDRATREAVLEFQEEAAIYTDGIAGPQTIGALSVLQLGDEGNVVLALQESLDKLGYYNGRLDGIFGQVTHNAVKSFQQSQGILVDGLAGPQTYGALHAAVKEARSASSAASNSSGQSSSNSPSQNTSQSSSKANSDTTSSSSSDEGSSSNDEETSSETSTESQDDATSSEKNSETSTETSRSSSSAGRTMTVEATAYTAYCNGCSGITATGLDLRNNPGKKVIAVDPSVIPLGSQVDVEGYGVAIAGDTGGAIKGNKIDLFMPNREDALNFGRRTIQITVLE